jgi:hypothetical protein
MVGEYTPFLTKPVQLLRRSIDQLQKRVRALFKPSVLLHITSAMISYSILTISQYHSRRGELALHISMSGDGYDSVKLTASSLING